MENILYIIFTSLIYSFGLSTISDICLRKLTLPSARYYLLHIILNSYIVYITYSDTYQFCITPFSNYNEYVYSSIKSASVIIGFHVYHYITDTLDSETKIHHIVTVFITGGVSLMRPTGRVTAAVNFFMCGLPGGIDYILLVLYKYNVIGKLTEKYINRWLNLLIRMPGMMLCSWYVILNIIHNRVKLPDNIIMIIAIISMTSNAVYYCNKTVGNYYIRQYEMMHKLSQ